MLIIGSLRDHNDILQEEIFKMKDNFHLELVCCPNVKKDCFVLDTIKQLLYLNEFDFLDYKEFAIGTIQQRTKPSEN